LLLTSTITNAQQLHYAEEAKHLLEQTPNINLMVLMSQQPPIYDNSALKGMPVDCSFPRQATFMIDHISTVKETPMVDWYGMLLYDFPQAYINQYRQADEEDQSLELAALNLQLVEDTFMKLVGNNLGPEDYAHMHNQHQKLEQLWQLDNQNLHPKAVIKMKSLARKIQHVEQTLHRLYAIFEHQTSDWMITPIFGYNASVYEEVVALANGILEQAKAFRLYQYSAQVHLRYLDSLKREEPACNPEATYWIDLPSKTMQDYGAKPIVLSNHLSVN
jgi:hypothetical protein